MNHVLMICLSALLLAACTTDQSAAAADPGAGQAGAAVVGAEGTALTSSDAVRERLQGERVLLKFGATWCGPCQKIKPELAALADSEKDLTVIDVDVDHMGDLAGDYNVQSIPAIFLLQDGEVVDSSVGYQDRTALQRWIDQQLPAGS
ncbi:MAG: thioredoxin family protein [Planctomycetota bacterium]